MTFRDLFRADDPPYRSTDYPQRPVHLRVNRTVEEIRSAALESVQIWCGFCSGHWLDNEDGREALRHHKCRSASGVDLTQAKLMHLEGAHRARLALKRWNPPPCEICGVQYGPGTSHNCSPPTPMFSVDVDAAKFQRQGSAAALAADIREMEQ